MDARNEILQGIDSVPLKGTPGRIVVFGDSAEPVLTAACEEEVLIAAADIGRGRLVVASHSGFVANFSANNGPNEEHDKDDNELDKLQKNIKKWLSRGSHHHKDPIANASDISEGDLQSYRIVYWSGGNAGVPVERMLDFVRGGGGLFHAVTPWGWLMGNTQKSISDIPYWDVLMTGGLCYTGDYCSAATDPSGYSVRDNKAAGSHLRRYLQDAAHDLDKACASSGMMKLLEQVPESSLTGLRPLLEPLWQKCDGAIQLSPIANGNPAQGNQECGILCVWQTCQSILGLMEVKAAGIKFFPGDFGDKPPVRRVAVEFSSTDTDYYFTGCYAPAGQTIKVVVNSGNRRTSCSSSDNWRVMIGCHTDRLSEKKLSRWPQIVTDVKLSDRVLSISSPFGGSIYFVSPPSQCGKIGATLENVVESPQFRLLDGEKRISAWNTSRLTPGLWADISGQFITITLPASSVRDIEDPTEAIKAYDELISSYHELRGTDVTKARRQWIVTDKQTGAGYMHAGYPVVTHLDVSDPKSSKFLMSVDKLRRPDTDAWGLFHEIGHNMQRSDWTFDGTVEVTVNIFTLFATEKFLGEKPWLCPWLAKQVTPTVEYLSSGAPYKEWTAKPNVALVVYAELARDFGWDAYRKVFRRYEAMPAQDKPKNNQEKIDQWYTTFSEVAGFNLTPLAMFWGIPLSKTAIEKLKDQGLQYFLPDDEMTQAVPARTELVIKKFPGLVRQP